MVAVSTNLHDLMKTPLKFALSKSLLVATALLPAVERLVASIPGDMSRR